MKSKKHKRRRRGSLCWSTERLETPRRKWSPTLETFAIYRHTTSIVSSKVASWDHKLHAHRHPSTPCRKGDMQKQSWDNLVERTSQLLSILLRAYGQLMEVASCERDGFTIEHEYETSNCDVWVVRLSDMLCKRGGTCKHV